MVGTPSSNSWVACVLEIHEYKVFAKLRCWKKKFCVQVQIELFYSRCDQVVAKKLKRCQLQNLACVGQCGSGWIGRL